MESCPVIAVIPARFASSRFPGKPLALLSGRPMIAHVIERCREAGCFDEVLVATDDERIANATSQAGGKAVLTGPANSGTDRIALAVRDYPARIVLNVQGDEPALPPANLRLLVDFLRSHPEVGLATLALPGQLEDLNNPNVVKVVCDVLGKALYFSRAGIPFPRNTLPGLIKRHVGLYGFRKDTLLQFTALPEADIERAEGLEQLRALWYGIPIWVLDTTQDSVAVDIPADVERAEAALATLKLKKTKLESSG